jgi:hypothetical protein
VATRVSITGETIVTLELAYTPGLAAAGADGRGLDRGECSWADRGLGDNGPPRIRFETVADGQIRQRQHGTTIDNSPTAAERFPDARNIPEYLKDPNHYWSFFIASSNKAYYLASAHRYWKPGEKIVPTGPGSSPGHPHGQADINDQIRNSTGGRFNDAIRVDSVSGIIRWRKTLGLVPEGPASRNAHLQQCGLFVIEAFVSTPSGRFGDLRAIASSVSTPFDRTLRVREDGDYYYCPYLLPNLPENTSLLIKVRPLDKFIVTTRWIGGSQPEPPPGYGRYLSGNRSVMLTGRNPQARVDFEVVYAPASAPPR